MSSVPPGAVTVNRTYEETAQMRNFVSLAAAAALVAAALFGADLGPYWP